MLTYENGRYRDLDFTLANHSYRGRSIGSEETSHQFPGYGLCFDIGGPPLSATSIPRVFITHGHADHVGGAVRHALRRKIRALEAATYYIGEDNAPHLREMDRVQQALARSHNPPMQVVPVGVGSEVPVDGKLFVRPFRAVHTIPCLGYALWSRRRKLRPEFAGMPGPEIGRRKKAGEDVDVEVEVPEVAFPGDTSIRVYETDAGDVLRRARLLLLECTFVDEESTPKDTFRAGHVHLEHILDAARQGAFDGNEAVLLTHFSARYHPDHARDVVTAAIRGTALEGKAHLLLPEPRR